MWQPINLTDETSLLDKHNFYLRKIPVNVGGRGYLFDIADYELIEPNLALYQAIARLFQEARFQTELPENLVKLTLSEDEIIELTENDILLNNKPTPPPVAELKSELSDLEINVSQTCNMGCEYCCVGKGEFGKAPIYLTIDKSRAALDELVSRTSSKQHHITFFGGEPLLNYPVIRDTILYAHSLASKCDREFSFRILTNGTAFNSENAKFLIEHGVELQISIDGSQIAHNRWRVFRGGQPTYENILGAINRYFTDSMHLITVRATMTKGNLNASTIYQSLRDIGFSKIIVAHANGNFEASNYSEKDLQELRDGYSQLASLFLEQAVLHESVEVIGAPFNDHIRILTSGERKDSYCGAGVHFVGLSARGEYAFCQDLAENPLAVAGNVSSGVDLKIVREYVDLSTAVDRKPVCFSCWARYICGGGCAALAISENRNIAYPYTPDCELIRHNIALSAWIISQLQENCPRAFFAWLDNPSLLSLLP